jgi:hypothetical protein
MPRAQIPAVVQRFVPVVLAFLALAGPASAGGIGVTLGFKPGALTVAAPADALGGSVQVPVTVVDARGSGAGWQLRLSGMGAPAVTRIVARCGSNSSCTLPKGTIAVAGTTTIFAAAPHSGMGVIHLVVTVSGGHGPLSVSVR